MKIHVIFVTKKIPRFLIKESRDSYCITALTYEVG